MTFLFQVTSTNTAGGGAAAFAALDYNSKPLLSE